LYCTYYSIPNTKSNLTNKVKQAKLLAFYPAFNATALANTGKITAKHLFLSCPKLEAIQNLIK